MEVQSRSWEWMFEVILICIIVFKRRMGMYDRCRLLEIVLSRGLRRLRDVLRLLIGTGESFQTNDDLQIQVLDV